MPPGSISAQRHHHRHHYHHRLRAPRGWQFIHFVLLVGEAMCRGYFEADAEDVTTAAAAAATASITIAADDDADGGSGSSVTSSTWSTPFATNEEARAFSYNLGDHITLA